MKKLLVIALALVMAVCSLAMVGCGKGVSYEDFNAKATALKASDPGYTKGTFWFKYGGEEDFGADIDFEIVDGVVKYDESRVAQYYGASAVDGIGRYINSIIVSNRYVWDVEEIEEKDEKTESGTESKVTVVYETKDGLSYTGESYLKSAKGNEQTNTVTYKYNSAGYIVEFTTTSVVNGKTEYSTTVKVEWKAE